MGDGDGGEGDGEGGGGEGDGVNGGGGGSGGGEGDGTALAIPAGLPLVSWLELSLNSEPGTALAAMQSRSIMRLCARTVVRRSETSKDEPTCYTLQPTPATGLKGRKSHSETRSASLPYPPCFLSLQFRAHHTAREDLSNSVSEVPASKWTAL